MSGRPSNRVARPACARATLANGLRVLVVEHHALPTVAINLLIRSGSASNPLERAGLADLVAEMLPAGTTERTGEAIAERVESLGATLAPTTGWDSTSLVVAGLAADTEEFLSLLAEIVMAPAFPEGELAELRRRRLGELMVRRESPAAQANDLFAETLYPAHPYGLPPDGTPDSVAGVDRSDLQEFHGRHARAANALLVVAGDVVPASVLRAAERALGSWAGGPATLPALPASTAPRGIRVVLLDRPELSQTQIRIGHLGVARRTPDWFPLTVANHLLGGGGFSSRLMDRIRVQKGYTYGVSSAFAARRDGGPFTIATYTPNETVSEVVGDVLSIVRALRAEGARPEELAAARGYFVSSYPRGFETPAGIAAALAELDLYELPEDHIETWQDRMDAVTAPAVLKAASDRLDPDNLVLALVGNAGEVAPRLRERLEADSAGTSPPPRIEVRASR